MTAGHRLNKGSAMAFLWRWTVFNEQYYDLMEYFTMYNVVFDVYP